MPQACTRTITHATRTGNPQETTGALTRNSSPNAPGGNRAYGTRQNNTRNDSQDFERRSNNGYQSPRPRPSGAPRPDAGEPRPNGTQRSNGSGPSSYRSDGPRYNGTQRSNGNGPSSYRSDGPRYNGTQRSNGSGPSSYRSDGPRYNGTQRSNDSGPSSYRSDGPRYNGTQRSNGNGPSSYRSDEPRHNSTQRNPDPHRPGPRPGFRPAQERGPQINKPEGEHPRRGAGRQVHPEKEYRPRPNDLKPPKEERPPHPRFLSRPEVRREREAKRNEEYTQQFEGDYEQFDTDEATRQIEPLDRPTREEHQPHNRNSNRHGNNQERERFVTPLPDGRVLKGPRPVQRRNAQFWTDINSDTDALIDQVQLPAKETVSAEQVSTEEGEQTDATQDLTAKRAPGTARRKKAETTKKPRSTGPKPSQKGYKWPTS